MLKWMTWKREGQYSYIAWHNGKYLSAKSEFGTSGFYQRTLPAMKDEYEHMFFGRNIYFAPVFCRIVRKSSDLNLLLRVRINSIPNFFFFF